ncbi:hydroxyisourate hydrolase [Pseudoclavibacter helvolus]|uniref:5-hydroxyisourate hydrolase n=1 Tax=Pseudoclavibacter helvolus TaxID=255205 RepID=A0A7W4UKN3_9MICO|nr:hydroxyisourate hydrolase [Pseudoclavibacter helvolus]MBB2956229.1 5-hydroxyisourate hydrolase [Pseudoclavibacter helvolus]
MTSQITSHVLDSSVGLAAAGVRIRLRSLSGQELGEAVTDADGRVTDLGPALLPAGTYELVFETGAYFAARGVDTFYPHIAVAITVAAATEVSGDGAAPHYHVPLLLSPFAYSTYRGT